MFWLFRTAIIFIPVCFSYTAAKLNINSSRSYKSYTQEEGDNLFLALMADGQVCFISFSIAASSITNFLAIWILRQPTLIEIFVFFVLLIISFFSMLLYYLFNGMFVYIDETQIKPDVNKQEKDEEQYDYTEYNKERIRKRNVFITFTLLTVIGFSLIADVFLIA